MIIPEFTPTEFSTIEDKQKFVKHFVRFVEGGFKKSQFPKWFYNRLSMTRGHIAHYNIHGFYEEWFQDKESQQVFLKHWANSPVYGDPAYTYSDVERFLSNYIKTIQ
jgi:hypothetical protein